MNEAASSASTVSRPHSPSDRGWILVPAGVLALLLGLAACSTAQPVGAEGADWGGEATEYFEQLSAAYRDHDDYRVLDFHTSTAEVEKWRGDLRGGGRVSDVLIWNSGDLSQDLEAVFLGGHEALTLVTLASEDERAAVVTEMDNGLIVHETVFDLAASLQVSVRQDPMVLEAYQRLHAEYEAAWGSDRPDRAIAALYADGAIISDSLFDVTMSPEARVDSSASEPGFPAIEPPPESNAIYLGPSDYGRDPQRAIGVYEAVGRDGCRHLMAVLWQFVDGLIIHEERYHEVESLRECATEGLPEGWWTGLELPGPSDEVVTGTITTPTGRIISVHNGTPRLEEAVADGLRRFADIGLPEPQFDTLTFEPTRKCESRTGRVIETDGFRELYLCMYERDLCPRAGSCDEIARTARLAVLHELGHAWMIDEVDEAIETRVLESSGLPTWSDSDVPWNQRGVEYAAEVLAWGLFDEDVSMVRIGSPSCAELTAAFTVLTSAVPLRTGGLCLE